MKEPTLEDQFGPLVIATVPATRKLRGEIEADRQKRRDLRFALEGKAADIVERVGFVADEPDDARVSEAIARQLRHTDAGQGAVLQYQNLVSRLRREPHSLKRTTSTLELLSQLAFSGSSSDRPSSTGNSIAPSSSGVTSRTSMLDIPLLTGETGRQRMLSGDSASRSDRARPSSSREKQREYEAEQEREREREARRRAQSEREAEAVRQKERSATAQPERASLRKGKQPARDAVRSSSPERIRGFELQAGQRIPRKQLLEQLRARAGKPELPESDILRDMIYVLQGIDGKWVHFDEIRDLPQPDQDEPGKVLRVRFDEPNDMTIPPKRRETIRLLAELGILHRRVCTFSEERMRRTDAGLIMQSLCVFINTEMTDYYRLIATLETQLSRSKRPGEDSAAATDEPTTLTLKRISAWTADAVLKTRLLSSIIQFGQDSHGGKLISLIHEFTHSGDPFIHKFATRVLQEVSKPFFHTLTRWIYEGELADPLREFFVELTDPLLAVSSAPDVETDALSLWQSKFAFREEMLPSFVGVAFARKIFSTGKSLNFIRYSLGDSDWIATRNRLSNAGGDLRYEDIAGLEQTIDNTYKIASQRLLDIFLNKFKLLDHLRALMNYMLLARGDFVDLLLSSLNDSLSKPAKGLFRHNLTACIETAIRGSNAVHEDPDIVRRLDAQMRPAQEGDTGWEVFSLGYQVDSPVNLVLDAGAMEGYQTIFLHLWRMKRVEAALGISWSRLNMTSKLLSKMPKAKQTDKTRYLRDLSSRTLMQLAEQVHFVRQTQGFCQLEVIDYSWHDLLSFFAKRQGDLDELIQSHRAYLNALMGKVLLRGGRRGTSPDHLAKEMQAHMQTMLSYSAAADDLAHYVDGIITQRQLAEQGLSSAASTASSLKELKRIMERLDEHSKAFGERTNAMLAHLRVHPNLVVRDLSVRLNYNNFYETSSRRRTEGTLAPTQAAAEGETKRG